LNALVELSAFACWVWHILIGPSQESDDFPWFQAMPLVEGAAALASAKASVKRQ
jgi:hypothetical protein